MNESERYDVVIIGDDLASAMAGALLAAQGLKVRLLDTPCTGHRRRDPLICLFTAPTAKRLIEALDVGPALRSRVDGPAKGITVALPDRRFSLPPSDPDRRECLAMMFPDAQSELRALLEIIERQGAGLDPILSGECMLLADTYRNRRKWRRHLAEHPLPGNEHSLDLSTHTPLGQFVNALLAFIDHPPITGQGLPPSAARALWHVFHGIIPYREGRVGFRRLFIERMRQSDGVGTASAPVESLVVKWRRARAVILEDKTRIDGRCFLFDSESLLSRIWNPAGPSDSIDVQCMRVHAPSAERPEGLQDPCAWLPAPPGPGCRLRVDEDGLDLRWQGTADPPPVAALSPLGTLSPATPVSSRGPDETRIDPYGVYRRPLVGPLKNIGLLGDWVAPGLGLESAC